MKKFWVFLLFYGVFGAPYQTTKYQKTFSKIIGGTAALPGELPYMLSIQDTSFGFNFHFCGASIYNELWAVSAAQCFQGENSQDPSYLIAVAGELNTNIFEGTEQVVTLSTFIQHEDFNGFNYNNDIALIKLSEPLVFDDFVKPLPLPPSQHSASGNCSVSGWGTTVEGGEASKTLLKAEVPIVTDQQCYLTYGDALKETMICAGLPEGGVDACTADTGGPLVCSDIGISYLAGIVSWGYGCGRPGTPKVYTEVMHFVDWIQSNIS